MPDGLESAFVPKTMHAYFIELMNKYGISLNKEKVFNAAYEEGLSHLIECIKGQDESFGSEWDYVLIDEGQDWSENEVQVITMIYKPHQIIVADGIDQFVRAKMVAPWNKLETDGKARRKELDISLRQKPNLVNFNNKVASKALIDWQVKSSDTLNGGNVIVTNQYGIDFHKQLMEQCRKDGCSDYDVLFLMDSTAGQEQYIYPMLNYWEAIGIKVFNGIDTENRNRYATIDECRLYNYNSCRGLEGWIVICHNLDRLFEEKIKFSNIVSNGMESETDRQLRIRKETFKWLMMPLTRAIDTLVITINNPEGELSLLLKEIANETDLIKWEVK